MHPYAWELRWDEALATALLAVGYVLALRFFPASRARKRCFAAAVALLVLAFQTPLERIALHYLLTGHLLQNVVLAEWAPLLAVLGVPPAMAAAMTRPRTLKVLTHPLVALPLWLVTYYAWHAPPVYDYALRHPGSLLHLEHLSYFVTGALMWWPVVHDSPREWSSGSCTKPDFRSKVSQPSMPRSRAKPTLPTVRANKLRVSTTAIVFPMRRRSGCGCRFCIRARISLRPTLNPLSRAPFAAFVRARTALRMRAACR